MEWGLDIEMARNDMQIVEASPWTMDGPIVVEADLVLEKDGNRVFGCSPLIHVTEEELATWIGKNVLINLKIFSDNLERIENEGSVALGCIWVSGRSPRIAGKIIEIEDHRFEHRGEMNHRMQMLIDCGILVLAGREFTSVFEIGDIVSGTGWFLLGNLEFID